MLTMDSTHGAVKMHVWHKINIEEQKMGCRDLTDAFVSQPVNWKCLAGLALLFHDIARRNARRGDERVARGPAQYFTWPSVSFQQNIRPEFALRFGLIDDEN